MSYRHYRKTALAGLCALAIGGVSSSAFAQDEATSATPTDAVATPVTDAVPDATAEADEYFYPVLHEGSLSPQGEMEEDASEARRMFRTDTRMQPWFDWKQQLRENTGLTIGGSYGILAQGYSTSPAGQTFAIGHKFTFNLAYELFNKGQPDALVFEMAIEDRRSLNSDPPPLFAGFRAGSLLPTAATWGSIDLGVTQAYIRQNLFRNRFQYSVGRIFAPNFVNSFPLFDDNRQFFNQTFSTGPSIQSPLRGFGMVAAWFPTKGGLYLQSGMYGANSRDTGNTISDFFGKSEHFYHLDVGWSGLARTGVPIHARGPMDSNNFSITGWYRNAQENGTPQSEGIAFNANWMTNDSVMLFVRGGWSDGWAIKRNLTTGLGWRPANAPADLFGVGIGYAEPENPGLRKQYTTEIFYRFHVTPHLAITPDLQMIVDPALSPGESLLFVTGLRARLAF
jgi:carbohydrate-selective porin OprB